MKLTSNYKIENYTELNNERLKSLYLFYLPLLNDESINIYLKLACKVRDNGSLKELVKDFDTNIDKLKESLNLLSAFKLIQILENNDGNIILALYSPLSTYSFIRSNIYSKLLIKKIGGSKYQDILINNCLETYSHSGYSDVSAKPDLSLLDSWNSNDEKYCKSSVNIKNNKSYIFDTDKFLKDTSQLVLNSKYRTKHNMDIIAYCGDLYGVDEKAMKKFIKDNIFDESNSIIEKNLIFNIESGHIDTYKEVKKGDYKVYNVPFLMSLQGGKEVSQINKKLLRELKENYHLNTEVLNVLLEYSLKTCDNRLNPNYLKTIASDLYRNDIDTSEKALKFLNNDNTSKKASKAKKEDYRPVYEDDSVSKYSDEEMDNIINLMGDHNG